MKKKKFTDVHHKFLKEKTITTETDENRIHETTNRAIVAQDQLNV